MILPITLTVAAALTLLNVGLALGIVQKRLGGKILLGTGGDPEMEARTRAQANLVEYAPFFLILSALLEFAGVSAYWLWVAGVAFVLARVAHAFGMIRPAPNPFRAGGAVATWLLLLLLGAWALAEAYAARVPANPAVIEPTSANA